MIFHMPGEAPGMWRGLALGLPPGAKYFLGMIPLRHSVRGIIFYYRKIYI